MCSNSYEMYGLEFMRNIWEIFGSMLCFPGFSCSKKSMVNEKLLVLCEEITRSWLRLHLCKFNFKFMIHMTTEIFVWYYSGSEACGKACGNEYSSWCMYFVMINLNIYISNDLLHALVKIVIPPGLYSFHEPWACDGRVEWKGTCMHDAMCDLLD